MRGRCDLAGAVVLVLVLVPSAACFRPDAGANLPCGPALACPGGLVCDGAECVASGATDAPGAGVDAPRADAAPRSDAAVDGSVALDSDGDDVVDATDNCPARANRDQHDEDGDATGDVCDTCPHVADPDQADAGEVGVGAEADGVGDACDPFPALGGDRIALFLPFSSAMGLSPTGGAWSVSGDDLVQSSAASADDPKALTSVVGTVTRVEADLTITALAASGYRTISVVAGSSMDRATYHHCIHDDDGDTVHFQALEHAYPGGFEYQAFTAMPPLGLGRRTFRLGVDPLAGQASCWTSTTGMEVSAALVLPSGLVGVRTYAAAVRVHSFVVFTR